MINAAHACCKIQIDLLADTGEHDSQQQCFNGAHPPAHSHNNGDN